MDLIKGLPESMQAAFEAYTLTFKRPSGTSRGILTEKKCWLLHLWSDDSPARGTGECSVIPGLSPDYSGEADYERALTEICENPVRFLRDPSLLRDQPSLLFGLEMAFIDWKNGGKAHFFDSDFTRGMAGIPINGLIWMGDEGYMQEQIAQKLDEGFSCIKMKVGAIDFRQEVRLLEQIRSRFGKDQIVLRVDANGAFLPREAPEKLAILSGLDLHSIEQPIAPGQWDILAELCSQTPLPIALDEELIPIVQTAEKRRMLHTVRPQYIILKPSLHGAFSGCREWIDLADESGIPWWITSALESNIGLNAIAQFTGTFDPALPQGLGTGGLYTSNFDSPLFIRNGNLYYSV